MVRNTTLVYFVNFTKFLNIVCVGGWAGGGC